VTKKIPGYLKLHVEPSANRLAGSDDVGDLWSELCRAFQAATGWTLRFDATAPRGEGVAWSEPLSDAAGSAAFVSLATPGRNGVLNGGEHSSVDLESAQQLAHAVAELRCESVRLRRAVREREAELAAGVPVVSRGDDERHLAQRLEAVLRGGAESAECDAAALYLLDDATSVLKLRAAWGLPDDRLLAPPRELRTALADLEALVGHAVVLEDTFDTPHWRAPEDFAAAVCVPVSTPMVPLGTLWVFSRLPRTFSDRQTNLIEIVAGRIAADLEREMLLSETVRSKRLGDQVQAVTRPRVRSASRPAPLLEDWRIAAWTGPRDGFAGEFHDWLVRDDDTLLIAVGAALASPPGAALTLAALQAAVHAHAGYARDPRTVLSKVNETLWTGSLGDQPASLLLAQFDTTTGRLEFAVAGQPLVLLSGRDRLESLSSPAPPLGTSWDDEPALHSAQIEPGEILLLLGEEARRRLERGRTELSDLEALLRSSTALPLDERLERIGDQLKPDAAAATRALTIVGVERRAANPLP
jgi:GAF domain-containing protein